MKEHIQKALPAWILKGYKAVSMRFSRFRNMETEEIFNTIYNTNNWKSIESISGSGSELKQTESLINDLRKLFNDLKPSSVLDIPCGNFGWMQKLDYSGIHYTGADIVEDIISKNIQTCGNRNHTEFRVLNLISDPLPKADIVIVRDCFVHFAFEDIFKALANIKASGSRYLLTTTFPDHKHNYNIITGDWRTLNLEKEPFNFKHPILIINENCTENNGRYADKSMALWTINEIQLP